VTSLAPVLGRPVRASARLAAGGLILLAALLAFAAAPAVSHADACTPPVTNPVACENLQPGADPFDWQVNNAGDSGIQGFATSQSVNKGDTISFKVKSDTTAYHIDIYRIGYYGGQGARLIQGNLTPTNTAAQPACQTFQSTGLVDCGNWNVSRSWTVPSTAVSGVYLAVLKRNSTGSEALSQIVFVVRDDASHSDLLYQTSDETWQAYNQYGGASLYTCTTFCPDGNPKAYKAAFKVSYNRPVTTELDSDGSSLFNGSEYPMIRWLEQSGYNVSYFSGVDSNSRGSLIQNHKVFISSGHDEYVSVQQRANLEAARDAGVNMAFFSGNEMFWRTRFESSQAGTTTADRTLVAYKDTHFDAPTDPVTWTGTWRDRRFSSVNTPENALTGQSFVVNAGTSRITVPYAYRLLRLWRNTAATSLAPGGSLPLAPNTLGYEWDVDPDNGFRPAGSFRVSSTTVSGLDSFIDYGSTLQLGNTTQTHTMTEYRVPSGALVFGAGTVQWAWGLSDWKNRTPDRNMQQATVNLFADMGAQPTTLVNGVVAATKSTDTTAPTSTLNAPPATVADGSTVNLTGTASDVGGQVGGVEVSTDGGSTWHPATGTTSWSYSWTAHGAPSTTIKVRATDDSGNIQTPGAGTSVNVSCSCTIFANSVPPIVDSNDNTPVEVGVKFQSDTYGSVTGIRFYKASTNTGTHTGSLWTASGTRLAQATFTGETASGWQTVTFDQPVQVLPNTTYIASYHAPNGHYSAAQDFFYRAPAPGPNGGANTDSPPLHALHNTETTGNGVFAYGSASTFPTQSFGAGNYYVDVMFTRIAAPGAVSNVSASARGLTSATVTWTAPTSGGAPTSYKITPYVGSTAQTATTITGTPPVTTATITGLTNGTTYTFTVQAINPNGSGPESAQSNSVTPLTAVAPSVPRDVQAQPASQSARVTWTAPEADGDSAITGYTVTPYIGATAQTPVQAGASATSAMVTGLNNTTNYTFRVTATNGVGTSVPGISAAVSPQATIFDFATPATVDSGDIDPVELGVKFKPDFNGTVTGVRFYKAATNTGSHIGSLWTTTGTRLAQATFTNESASGWQSVTFATPVAVTAGTTYIASYFTPTGHYSVNGNGGMASGVDNPPLHAIADSTSPNGVYAYGSGSSFPANTYHAANYWVDVLYALPLPGQATGVTATAGRRSASLTWTAPAGGGPVTGYKITPYIGSTAQTATTVSGSSTSATVDELTSGTAYTFTVQATNDSGSGPASAASNSVTPTAAVAPSAPTGVLARPGTSSALVSWSDPANDSGSAVTGHTITPYIGSTAQTPMQVGASATSATVTGLTNGSSYTFTVTRTNGVGTSPASVASDPITPRATIFDFATPTTIDSGDTSPVELGVKFKADVDGSVTGIRFYKAAANTGAHIGSLWTTGGSRLAQATFTGESASGWQTVTFSSPVAVDAGTTYVASYFAPNGHYSHTSGGLASGANNGVLHALADGTVNNGVYSYGGVSSFPTGSFNAADYGVDVLFAPSPVPGPVSGVSATAGSKSAVVSWTAPTSGGDPTSYKVTPYIGSSAQTTTTVSAPATNVTVTGLTAGTAYTFTVQPHNGGGDGPESAHSNSVTPTAPSAPAAPTGVSAQPASTSARVSWTAPPESGSPITGYTITPFIGSSAQTTVSASGSATSATVPSLTNGTAYTFKVTATNAVGTGPASAASDPVTPRAAILDFATPAVVDGGDSSGIALGVKFKADVDGSVTGLRFYKAAANTGTHVGSLYSAGGSLLGQATFTGESASGWQSVTFATPVAVTAGTTYVASYHAPNGHYSVTSAAFASGGVDNAPLHALSDLVTANGVYSYSGSPVFPSSNFNATNYWVDVLFAPGA
jgi:N,N-dimethylformamidase beta subunit-like protein/uncharacterized protein DUF4082/fibronectin type III domain protein